MNGDRHKPESEFSRWVEYFRDGFKRLYKGHRKIPTQCSKGKKYNTRWLRRTNKCLIKEDIEKL